MRFLEAFFCIERGLLHGFEVGIEVRKAGVDGGDVAGGDGLFRRVLGIGRHGYGFDAEIGKLAVGLGEFFEVGGEVRHFGCDVFLYDAVAVGAGGGFDAADAGGDGAFAFDFEEADGGCAAGVGAAAEFHRDAVEGSFFAAHLDDADDVAVFVAEELADVLVVLDVGVGHFAAGDGKVRIDPCVDAFFDGAELVFGDGGAVEVEAEAFVGDEGALLGDVRADDFLKSLVQQVGGAVVGFDGAAAVGIDGEGDGVSRETLMPVAASTMWARAWPICWTPETG